MRASSHSAKPRLASSYLPLLTCTCSATLAPVPIRSQRIFDAKAKEDETMRREARRFTSKLRAALRRAAEAATDATTNTNVEEAEEEEEPFAESLHRASRFARSSSEFGSTPSC